MAPRLNILVVEDHDDLRDVLIDALAAEGHAVQGAGSAEAATPMLAAGPVDIVIADLNLPGEDGLSLARRIRERDPGIGIVMATARGLPHEKRQGYDCGADIYLAKPLALEELTAAIAALARRLRPSAARPGLQLDRAGCRLHGPAARNVELTPNEAALLAALAAADGRLETGRLIELLRLDKAYDPKAALEVAIVRLRKKLKQAGAADPGIKAVRNWGYQLCEPMTFA